MTHAPAVAEPGAPATRPVILQVSEELLLSLLHLPEGTTLIGAQAEQWRGPRLILHLEMAGVPAGADEVHPVYETAAGPDPVRLTALRWLHDGDLVACVRVSPGSSAGP